MKVTKIIIDRLLQDRSFRLMVALDSGLSEAAILKAARTNASSLTKLKTINAISKHSGISTEELTVDENEIVNA